MDNALLALNLKWLMSESGLNPTSLSSALPKKPNGKPIVPQGTIFRIVEEQTESPRNSTLEPLAVYFRVKVSDLWEWDFTQHGRPNASAPPSNGKGKVIEVTTAKASHEQAKTKAKQSIKDLRELRDEDFDGYDVLAIQNLLARIERGAVASFTKEPDGDTEK